jgi:hypothetical protein
MGIKRLVGSLGLAKCSQRLCFVGGKEGGGFGITSQSKQSKHDRVKPSKT